MGKERGEEGATQHSRTAGKAACPAYPSVRWSALEHGSRGPGRAGILWGGGPTRLWARPRLSPGLFKHTPHPLEKPGNRGQGEEGVEAEGERGAEGRNLPGNDCIWELSFL